MCFLLLDGQVMPDEAPTARFTAREREREKGPKEPCQERAGQRETFVSMCGVVMTFEREVMCASGVYFNAVRVRELLCSFRARCRHVECMEYAMVIVQKK